MSQPDQITAAGIAAIEAAADQQTLELVKAQYLGKTGELNALLKQLGQMSPEARWKSAKPSPPTSTNATTASRLPTTPNATR